jgi:DNA (cytosine-5)-methyltransferase 1
VSRFKVVDLFAGCGGLTAGFAATGRYESIAAVEIDPMAAATYAANFGDHVHTGDIREWLKGELPHADVVIGGPPCQGFSALGRQDPNDPRNVLWREYVNALTRIRPAAFVIENVPQFLKSVQYEDLQREVGEGGLLEDYEIEAFVLNSADYGAPQARRRAVVFGRQLGQKALGVPPKSTVKRTVEDAWTDVPRSVREVDLPERPDGERGPYRSRELHLTRRPTPQSLERYAAIRKPGGNRHDLPDHLSTPGWRKHKTGSGDVMGRLWWDRPSVTIRTEFFKPEKGRYLHPSEDRPITHYEAARLQGFTDDFIWYGSKSDIARQIGNAVPVPLAEAVARHLLLALDAPSELGVDFVRDAESDQAA